MTAETYKPDPDQEQEQESSQEDDDYDPVAVFFEESLGAKEVEALNESIAALGHQINNSRNQIIYLLPMLVIVAVLQE